MREPKRIHTGRIISSEPALQNIPIRTEDGRRIRDMFQPSSLIFVDCDYPALETLAAESVDDNEVTDE